MDTNPQDEVQSYLCPRCQKGNVTKERNVSQSKETCLWSCDWCNFTANEGKR